MEPGPATDYYWIMEFGEQYVTLVDPAIGSDLTSSEALKSLGENGIQISQIAGSANESFFHDADALSELTLTTANLVFFKIDDDCVLEINDVRIPWSTVCQNRIGDIISFQFVSRVSRSEILGDVTNIHSLGPAIVCTAVKESLTSYRVPRSGEISRYVVVHTTLSNLMRRLEEDIAEYPKWLLNYLAGESQDSVQRVLFSDANHRDLIWPCFHLPVSGKLLKKWLSAKFWELLTVGLQSLKEDVRYSVGQLSDASVTETDRLRRARHILDREYASPPTLEALAKRLGLSQTRLKSGFKQVFGTTVMQYCLLRRVHAAKLLISENHLSIMQIADTIGYEDPSAFSRAFRRVTGQSPHEWRQSGAT